MLNNRDFGALRAGLAALVLFMVAAAPQARAASVERVVSGTVVDVDRGAKTLVVKSEDGIATSFRVSERAGKDALRHVGKGTSVAVVYTEEGAENSAVAVEHLGNKALRSVKGVVVDSDHATKTVTIDTGKGAKEVVHLGDRAVVDTGKGVVKTADYTVKAGDRLIFDYTPRGARKVAHVVRRVV